MLNLVVRRETARLLEVNVFLYIFFCRFFQIFECYVFRLSILFSVSLRPNAVHVILILEVSRLQNNAPQSVGLLWTSDQLVAETST
jgi:hypothetical protein